MGFKLATISVAAVVFIIAFVMVLDYVQDKNATPTTTTQNTNSTVGTSIDLPKYSGSLPDDELCEYNDLGFQCTLVDLANYAGNYDINSEEFSQRSDEFKKYCEDRNGTWKCYGFCLPEYEHYCDPTFTDSGEPCSNSDQCQGKCIVDSKYISENYPNGISSEGLSVGANFTGTCAENPLRQCDHWYELNSGIIENHATILCD